RGVPTDRQGPVYESLLQQAAPLLRGKPAQDYSILSQAIQANPNDPRAYVSRFYLELYGMGRKDLAISDFRAAIGRGGVVAFNVIHDESGLRGLKSSRGRLEVSRDGLAYRTDSNNGFAVPLSQITDRKKSLGPI